MRIKWLIFRYKFRKALLVAAVLALVFLPTLAIGSCAYAGVMLAQTTQVQNLVSELSTKSVAYWFVALAAVTITSWTWIVKWLINQLDSKRKTNAELTATLLESMKNDHSETKVLLAVTKEVLSKLAKQNDK